MGNSARKGRDGASPSSTHLKSDVLGARPPPRIHLSPDPYRPLLSGVGSRRERDFSHWRQLKGFALPQGDAGVLLSGVGIWGTCLIDWRARTGVSRVGKHVIGEGNPCPYEKPTPESRVPPLPGFVFT